MYLCGFSLAWWLGNKKAQRPASKISPQSVADLIFYGALGAVLGGRIGYSLFYNLDLALAEPFFIFRIWEGGMSFHGGLIGVMVACYLYGKKLKLHFFTVTDFLCPLVPLGLGLGRIGNFINTELPGRLTDLPWGLQYPCHAVRHLSIECESLTNTGFEQATRHPSALYQAMVEGLLLLAIMMVYTLKPRATGAVSGVFLISYGVLRIFTELFRSPDAHIGFILGNYTTLGQWLSLPMIALGLLFLFWSKQQMHK